VRSCFVTALTSQAPWPLTKATVLPKEYNLAGVGVPADHSHLRSLISLRSNPSQVNAGSTLGDVFRPLPVDASSVATGYTMDQPRPCL
jgi:hypothetical protein